jgi:hypothetical protein
MSAFTVPMIVSACAKSNVAVPPLKESIRMPLTGIQVGESEFCPGIDCAFRASVANEASTALLTFAVQVPQLCLALKQKALSYPMDSTRGTRI